MLYNYFEKCFSLVGQMGRLRNSNWDFAEKMKNKQKNFIKEVWGSGICLHKLNFLQKDDHFLENPYSFMEGL